MMLQLRHWGVQLVENLLSYARAAGCGCKMPIGALEGLLESLDVAATPEGGLASISTGLQSRDDAALLTVDADISIAATVDFGTPTSPDAKSWGKIAVAHALSDLYAVGARPTVALNIVGWPRKLAQHTLKELLMSASAAMRQEGAVLIGGHSIVSEEPLYGLCALGLVKPDQTIQVNTCQAGDRLLITKPLGTGIILAATKADVADSESLDEATSLMQQSNSLASSIAVAQGVRAGTDVSGYGLIGHANNLAKSSGLSVVIDLERVPLLESARNLLDQHGFVPNFAENNYFDTEKEVHWGTSDWASRVALCDAQTSGGLLLSAPPVIAEQYIDACRNVGLEVIDIGCFSPRGSTSVNVETGVKG